MNCIQTKPCHENYQFRRCRGIRWFEWGGTLWLGINTSHQEGRCLLLGPCEKGPDCTRDGVQPPLPLETLAQTKTLKQAVSEEPPQRSEFLSMEDENK